MLARLILESDMWCDFKRNANVVHVINRAMPVLPAHDEAEMRDRNGMTANRVTAGRGGLFDLVSGDLVTKKVDVYPALAFPADAAAKDVDVKTACCLEIGNRKGEVKQRPFQKLVDRRLAWFRRCHAVFHRF